MIVGELGESRPRNFTFYFVHIFYDLQELFVSTSYSVLHAIKLRIAIREGIKFPLALFQGKQGIRVTA